MVGAVVALCLAAAGLGGCAPYRGTTAQQVQEWAKQNSFTANHDQMVSDIIRVDKALKIGTVKQLRTICGGFASDIGTAYTTLPAPDQALTNVLNDADTTLENAATNCSGVSSKTSPAMQADSVKIHQGLEDLRKAQLLLATLGINWKIHL
ncbi:MAG: hypothetical protein ABSH30_05380 [Acidimicrobiales bacterium]|jgi:hypothetical protein